MSARDFEKPYETFRGMQTIFEANQLFQTWKEVILTTVEVFQPQQILEV